MKTNTFEILKERGYIYQSTNEEAIRELLNNKSVAFYLGIDPTADSLHIGHFFALTMVRRLQKLGHKAIVLVGGATALVGDPSGKKDLRKVLTKEQVEYNKKEVKELVKRFLRLDGENPGIIVDNSDWINKESYIDFMRNVGIHFNVNKMLSTDCYKNRLEEGGLTFLEMGYMLMQAYDFVHLKKTYNCDMQIGGSDQWANMVAGTDLYRKMNFQEGNKVDDIYALTCPLLVKADGEKMGKTASGTLWVSREKTTVYDFYQMFINSFDEDVERLLSFFSDYEISEIKDMCSKDIREAKRIMAFEVTKLVHGEEEANKAKMTSEEMFEKGIFSGDVPTIKISKESITGLLDIIVLAGLAPSKSEARRLVEQGGIKVNGEVVNLDFKVEEKLFEKELIISKGKKSIVKLELE